MKKKLVLTMIIIGLILLGGKYFFQEKVEDEDASDQKLTEVESPEDQDKAGEQIQKETEEGRVDDPHSNASIDHNKETSTPTEVKNSEKEREKEREKEKEKEAQTDQTKDQKETTDSKPQDQQSQKPPKKQESVTSILNRYFPEFQQLEFQQHGKLESLVQKAVDHYLEDKDTFNSNTYKAEANALQASSDKAFYSMYQQMQAELVENGHNKEAGREFAQTYESKKKSLEREFQGIADGF